ncbi:MAG: hypothetical protein K2M85_04025 [Paramuribaculum sp.]|nr:hypothetical protein [Paramuribaculum sp.]
MSAGTKYNLTPDYKPEELYRVETGIRKSGPWKLDTSNLTDGSMLPVFTPVEADVKKRTIVPVRNVELYEAVAAADTTIKIKKTPLVYANMFLGNGDKGMTVKSVDRSNKDYDELTLEEAAGAALEKGSILFESKAADGKAKKNVANFVMYDAKKVETNGIVLCTLLMQAYEVKEAKLHVPIHELDKAGLTSRFQFE